MDKWDRLNKEFDDALNSMTTDDWNKIKTKNKMDWRVIQHTESTDGKTEHITCELWVKFIPTIWNKSDESPIIKITYHDRKYESGLWLDKDKTKWHTLETRKSCSIVFIYFQRQTEKHLYSDTPHTASYNEFTLDYCKDYAVKSFKDRMNDVLNQLK